MRRGLQGIMSTPSTAPTTSPAPHRRPGKPGHLPRIGIIGGGQLGKMMAQAAKRMGFGVIILDPTPNAPAAHIADDQIVAGFDDAAAIRTLVEKTDVTTYDIEHISVEAIQVLWDEGQPIYPSPRVLGVVQDKLAQKQLFEKHDIPVPRYAHIGMPDAEKFASFGYPLVQKARFGGYDGKGVQILKTADDFAKALDADSFVEPMLELDKELAVMVARNLDGQIVAYPIVEMVFDPDANLLDLLVSPARIDDSLADRARDLAVRTVQALNCVGVYGVEMFLTKSGELLINEVAPRPHNSGHYTIEACVTHQFEQHLRAVLGLPLGDTTQLRPAAMVNLLGAADGFGPTRVYGIHDALALPGVSIHIYGKAESRPHRKMGHATVLADDLDSAIDIARRVRDTLTITGEEEQ